MTQATARKAPAVTKPDLTEARRLHAAGFDLVRLHHLEKRPVGEGWNQNAVSRIEERATGYGMPLAANGLCSVDPDQVEMARAGLAAWGLDLDELLEHGVRTSSTRPGSGGRAAFKVEPGDRLRWLSFRVFDDEGRATIVLELRAASPNLQDCVPGLVYRDKASGQLCTQQYANGRTFDTAPDLPERFARLWRWLSTDDEALRKHEARFVEGIAAAGFRVNGSRPRHLPSLGNGERLPFRVPGVSEPFNQAHRVEEIILEHGYAEHDRGRWSRPGATGMPGIRPIPGKDGLWQSDHAGDPLHGTFDAWSAHVILDHDGDETAAANAWRREQERETIESFDELPPLPEAANGPAPLDLEAARVGELLETDPPPRRWLIEDRLPLGLVGMLAAAGGTGKSMATLQLAVSVTTGLPWLDMPVSETGAVLMFSAEDDRAEVHRRLRVVVEHYMGEAGAFAADDFAPYKARMTERLFVFDRVGMDNRLTAKDGGTLRRTKFVRRVTETAAQVPNVAMIVLDPLARFDGGEPNDNADGTRLIECAEAIRKATGATVLLPHHVNKASLRDGGGGQESVRGGSGLVDAVRWVGLLSTLRPDQARKEYGLEPEEAGRFVRFTTPKANYSAPWGGCWLRRERGGVLVPVELEPVREAEKAAEAEAVYQRVVTEAAKLIRKHGPMSVRRLCDDHAGLSGVFNAGEKRVRAALNRAVEEGEFDRAPVPAGSGHHLHLPAGGE